ncbi:putative Translocation protein SEC62 [Hypsibius exemplaris]|uniref:Translocation protein SEC62 n=1 Tax=Hypsibius exemplaris TaxID=2072580 RepID=A0A1W0WT13_HYPEX|nr:putative Translocation protein SEC62 [Hypsibius exemplaris]
MAETRRRKGKGAQTDTPEGPTKEEYAVAKYLRNKCPKKQTKFFDDKVYYFIGSKAVDTLMESKWAKADDKKVDQLFRDRHDCADYLNRLLRHHLFIRGEKFEVTKTERPPKKKSKESEAKAEEKDKKDKASAKEKKSKAGKDEKSDEASDDEPESPKTDPKDSQKKKKKKIRLETHADQVFLDSNDAYVWMYEPTSVQTIAIGTVIVLGSIGACLFPLWPPIVRQGVYYLSLAMIGCLGLLIGTALFRYVVFAAVWALTGGQYNFWYLPNLTEDCGFFESFKPAYTLTKKGEEEKDGKSKKKKSKNKAKDSDKEEEDNELANSAAEEEKKVEEKSGKEAKQPKSPEKKTKKSRRDDEETSTASEKKVSEPAARSSPKVERSPKISPQVSAGDNHSDNGSTASSDDAFEVINASPDTDS